ncbi:MAG: hypothetical protein SP1CHLAM54_04420 [Chlamydiia bacterium]|nr:hypothetical protein [Chlamydiia bacterium]MCH9615356.1 hypothetical protein [Chlamydiia bacterium]MCH9628322.1 hypothetical protein [Chlamydiia bacterium]
MATTSLQHYTNENLSTRISEFEVYETSNRWLMVAKRIAAVAFVVGATIGTLYASPISGAIILMGLTSGADFFENNMILPHKRAIAEAQFHINILTATRQKLTEMESWSAPQIRVALTLLGVNYQRLPSGQDLANLKPLIARALVWQERAETQQNRAQELLADRTNLENVVEAHNITENFVLKSKLCSAYFLKLLSTPHTAHTPLSDMGNSTRMTWRERAQLHDHVNGGPYFRVTASNQEFTKQQLLDFSIARIAREVFSSPITIASS